MSAEADDGQQVGIEAVIVVWAWSVVLSKHVLVWENTWTRDAMQIDT